MERGSVQHGSRVDDEMAEEVAPLTHGAPTESHAREDLEAEPPGEGEPVPDALITAGADAGPAGLSHDDVELRSEIARHLRPSAFPGSRDTLILVADDEGASDIVLGLLASLPRDVEFHQVSDVWRALGHDVEHRAEYEEKTDITEAVPAAPAPAVEDLATEAPPQDVTLPEPVGTAVAPEAASLGVAPEDAPTRPGCNLAAIAASGVVETGGAIGRLLRRVLPLSS